MKKNLRPLLVLFSYQLFWSSDSRSQDVFLLSSSLQTKIEAEQNFNRIFILLADRIAQKSYDTLFAQ